MRSKEAAVRFVEKNGWEYEVQEPHTASSLGHSNIRGVGRAGTRVKQVRHRCCTSKANCTHA